MDIEKKCSKYTSATGFTPLMDVVMAGDHKLVKKLAVGDTINVTNSKGWTALHLACRNCNGVSNIKCVKVLIKAGANIDIQNTDGWTALMMACRYCNDGSNIECVNILIKAGANIDFQDTNGRTALMLACRYCNESSSIECFRELVIAGANLYLQHNNGITAKDFLQDEYKHLYKDFIRERDMIKMQQEIYDRIQRELWEYGGIGFELLHHTNQGCH